MFRTRFSTSFFSRRAARAALLCAPILLTACGFQPVYRGDPGEDVKAQLAQVDVGFIQDRVGQQLRNNLLEQISPFGRPRNPAFRLNVELVESQENLAVKKSEIATRANLNFAARFFLTPTASGSAGTPLLQGTSKIVTSYNILSSDFATLVAERNARERAVKEISTDIANRLAAFFRNNPRPAR